jgi:choice-of-anchor C domain-containing protein
LSTLLYEILIAAGHKSQSVMFLSALLLERVHGSALLSVGGKALVGWVVEQFRSEVEGGSVMLKSMKFSLFAAVAAAGLSVTSARADSMLLNGDFTQYSGTQSPSYTTIGAGSTFLTGWAVTSGSVDVINSYWPSPPQGGNSVDLDGDAPGAISQTLMNLSTGTTYVLSFELAANPDGDPLTKQLEVDIIPDAAPTDFTSDQYANSAETKNDAGWMFEDVTFKATQSTETLKFISMDTTSVDAGGGPSPYGPVIGNVAVTAASFSGAAVPLPASAGVGFSMLAGLGFLSVLRKKVGSRSRIA